jgi:hypothetical protein
MVYVWARAVWAIGAASRMTKRAKRSFIGRPPR